MDDKQEFEQEIAPKTEKKKSRAVLTFYIIGLFLVAIALIFISYISQVRSDKELEDLSSKLNEQQTVAQGFSQKVEEMQRQLDQQSSLIESAKSSVDVKTNEELLTAIENIVKQTDLQKRLLLLQHAVTLEDKEAINQQRKEIEERYTVEELSIDGGLLTEEEIAIWITLQQGMQETIEN